MFMTEFVGESIISW